MVVQRVDGGGLGVRCDGDKEFIRSIYMGMRRCTSVLGRQSMGQNYGHRVARTRAAWYAMGPRSRGGMLNKIHADTPNTHTQSRIHHTALAVKYHRKGQCSILSLPSREPYPRYQDADRNATM